MTTAPFATHEITTARHRTVWLEAGPAAGPLLVFVHGWPEIGLVWRAQLTCFAAAGWRCIAPDLRGYGQSAVPTAISAYTVREVVTDLVELHDALGGAPAVWVGHDWGSSLVWALAAHHAPRCRAVANLCLPYLARGFELPNLLPLIDRTLYPEAQYPVGQWDYFLYYQEHFTEAAQAFEADVAATLALLFRRGSPQGVRKPAPTATIRKQGGWFGAAQRAPRQPHDETMLSQADFEAFVTAYHTTGFSGANARYLNEAANLTYAAEAPAFGRLSLPVLFLHAAWDAICDTAYSRLAEPMRVDCANLREEILPGGHELMLDCPAEVNAALASWLSTITT